MPVKHSRDVPAQLVKAGDLTSMQVLISAQEAPHFAMRRFVMEPGGGMPKHTNTLEHEQYVLQGHAMIGIGDEELEVRPGMWYSSRKEYRIGTRISGMRISSSCVSYLTRRM
jgi:quercetin dioxygenase-like cupin family protein